MKTKPPYLLAAALTVGASLAMAQDAQPPVPATPPPTPSGDSSVHPPEPVPPAAPPVVQDHERHHNDHREGGPRPPEGWHHPGPMHPPSIPTKLTPYIGVVTSSLPEILSSQLGLADGFGLVISEVLPDSPAAKAGLQRYDVLTKFNDQQLVDSNQLATLVRAQKKDTEASLTFLRKAQEQKATVKIDEKQLPDRRALPLPRSGSFFLHRNFDSGRDDSPEDSERMHDFGEKMRVFKDRMKTWQKNPSADAPQPPEPPSRDGGPPIPPEAILREVQPGGVARIQVFGGDGNVTYNTANAKVFMKDTDGEIEITSTDGKRSLIARNAQGETVFQGPIDTEEQRKALPEAIRKKVELIEVKTKLAQSQRAAATAEPGFESDVQ